MLKHRLLALATGTLLATTATAQFCSDNQFPLRLVDQSGAEFARAFDPVTGENTYLPPNESVYLAFDPALPSGTYYVHVTDNPIDGFDEVLSTNDPMDRFVTVTNSSGVISLSLPFSSNPDPLLFGVGLGGQGQSIRLAPFQASQFSLCRFKAWYGDRWDLSSGPQNPYLLAGGIHPTTGLCAVRSYEAFRIGDGSGSDVTGVVFADTDRDGVRDAGEAGFANVEVRLVTGSGAVTATTDSSGAYRFSAVAAGSYTVELTVPSGFLATTALAFPLQVCQCADVAAPDFGAAQMMLPCNARTIGYWRNHHGLQRVHQFGILATLPMLHLRNTWGQHVAPGSLFQFKGYLMAANAWNMAYMLSAQLLAMHCNVAVGFVHPDCVIHDPCLGTMTVAQLMQQAVASLMAHGYTPPCSSPRHQQALLKNALDRANNNEIWR